MWKPTGVGGLNYLDVYKRRKQILNTCWSTSFIAGNQVTTIEIQHSHIDFFEFFKCSISMYYMIRCLINWIQHLRFSFYFKSEIKFSYLPRDRFFLFTDIDQEPIWSRGREYLLILDQLKWYFNQKSQWFQQAFFGLCWQAIYHKFLNLSDIFIDQIVIESLLFIHVHTHTHTHTRTHAHTQINI